MLVSRSVKGAKNNLAILRSGNLLIENHNLSIKTLFAECVLCVFNCEMTRSHNHSIKNFMIFGFNTDVKHGDTIYHVQSEARESEKLLQTQVFVRGRCIGKRADLLCHIGRGDDWRSPSAILKKSNNSATSIASCSNPFAKASWKLSWIKPKTTPWPPSSNSTCNGRTPTPFIPTGISPLQLHVTEAGAAVPAARLTFRFARPDSTPFYTQAVTDAGGNAEISIEVDESALPDSSVMVQANHEGRTVTRKFALRKAE